MSSYNKVILMGNITRDLELKYTGSGLAVTRIGMAMNRKWRDAKSNELREEVTYVDVEVFGKQAENAAKYLSKGKPLHLEGRLKLDSWDDKTTGQKVYKLKVICENFQFLNDGKPAGQNAPAQRPTGSAPTQQRPSGKTAAPPADIAEGVFDLDMPESEIPF